MIRRLLLVAAILFFNINAEASPHDKWWEAGNRFYSQKQYDSAAFYFEKIAALKPDDAAVYYNLGNTYYRLNRTGNGGNKPERWPQRLGGENSAGENLASPFFFVGLQHDVVLGKNTLVGKKILLGRAHLEHACRRKACGVPEL